MLDEFGNLVEHEVGRFLLLEDVVDLVPEPKVLRILDVLLVDKVSHRAAKSSSSPFVRYSAASV